MWWLDHLGYTSWSLDLGVSLRLRLAFPLIQLLMSVYIRFKTKSCRILYRKLIVTNIWKAVLLVNYLLYVSVGRSGRDESLTDKIPFWPIRIKTASFPYTEHTLLHVWDAFFFAFF